MRCLLRSPAVPPGLSTHECGARGSTLLGLLAVAWPAQFHNLPPLWVCQLPPCPESSMPWLSVSTPTTGLDECFFFICLVVGLPYSRIFCQFWLFFVLNCCWPSFGWVRRHSVSTYASILVGSPVPNLKENILRFCPLNLKIERIIGCSFVMYGPYYVEVCSLYSHFAEHFNLKLVLDFVQCLFCIY